MHGSLCLVGVSAFLLGGCTGVVLEPPGNGNGAADANGSSDGSGAASAGGSSGDASSSTGGSGSGGAGTLTIAPTTAQTYFGGTIPFTADNAVGSITWSIEEGAPLGGAISAAGIYIAPNSLGTFHVVATSGQQTATAAVTVFQTQVGACDSLAPVGTWDNITPQDVLNAFAPRKAANQDYGVFSFVVDPGNSGTVYLGTLRQGIWKTTDCGHSWAHIDTGTNGSSGDNLDSGMEWTFAIDPTNSQIVYTNGGYDAGVSGLFRSPDAGVDWDPIWPPQSSAADQVAMGSVLKNNFANTIALDPSNHKHMLLTFHEPCNDNGAAYNAACIAETQDATATPVIWAFHNGDSRWTTLGEGVKIFFLEDSSTWLWGSQEDGIWRSADGGGSWKQISPQNANHLQSTQMYRAINGTFLLAGFDDLWQSPSTGSAGTWTTVPGTSPLVAGIVSDGTTIYMSNSYFPDDFTGSAPIYFTAPESNPNAWTPMTSPGLSMMNSGGVLGYDKGHNLLYSSNFHGGFWRVVTK